MHKINKIMNDELSKANNFNPAIKLNNNIHDYATNYHQIGNSVQVAVSVQFEVVGIQDKKLTV